MKKQNTIKVWIEIPEKYLFDVDKVDLQSLMGWKRGFGVMLREEAVQKALEKLELPEITLDEGELKERVLDIMANEIVSSRLKEKL